MPTGMPAYAHSRQASSFALRGLGWSVALFGLIRATWIETHVVLPMIGLQARIATGIFGHVSRPVDVTLACSGADALALCVGAILAYPVSWRTRVMGASAGSALILTLNIARIGTLGRAVASPNWFEALHVYIWPALLTLAIAGYVLTWMRVADERQSLASPAGFAAESTSQQARRFVWLTLVFLVAFITASPLYLQSTSLLAVAAFVTDVAASALRLVGVHAGASANVLSTERGAFLITQECVATPLIPVYFSAIAAYVPGARRRALAVLIAAPLFVALGVARLLVVALPPSIATSPLFLVHSFSQLLIAGLVVLLAAFWRHGRTLIAWRRACLGVVAGGVLAYAITPLLARLAWSTFSVGPPVDDPQGALGMLPGFQVGLYAALAMATFGSISWRRVSGGLGLLVVSQIVAVAIVRVVAAHTSLRPGVLDVRVWALAGPILLVAFMVSHGQERR